VNAQLHPDGRIDVENVTSYRKARQIHLGAGIGSIRGDVAWAATGSFLSTRRSRHRATELEALTEFAWRVRQA